MELFKDMLAEDTDAINELGQIVECGILVKCKKDCLPFLTENIESTFYCAKDDQGNEVRLMFPPCESIGTGLVGHGKAKDTTEDFFIHQLASFNDLMTKILGPDEYIGHPALPCTTLQDVQHCWSVALEKFPYKGKFELGHDRFMFGSDGKGVVLWQG